VTELPAVLSTIWLGAPVWAWAGFLLVVLAILALDLGVLNRRAHAIGVRESLRLSVLYVSFGLAFGGVVWWWRGADAGFAYLTGFALEKALALDNVFVIALIFAHFAVPAEQRHRVLFWGVVGVLVLRAIMIGLGAALVAEAAWVMTLFALFLLGTGLKMLFVEKGETDIGASTTVRLLSRILPVAKDDHGDRFFVRRPKSPGAPATLHVTPLFLALATIEFADVIFAVDSVPAIFAVTTDPFVVYTSNIFAILGLRALYFALAAMIDRFHRLETALALVLIFIGAKVIGADLIGIEKVPAALSLGVTVGLLTIGVVWSLWETRDRTRAPARSVAE
jgi:tellurite resistance protein TerC